MRINPVLEKMGSYPIAAIRNRAREMRERGQKLIDFSMVSFGPEAEGSSMISCGLKD